MFKVEDFMNAFDPKAFDFGAAMANAEKIQKQVFDATEKNMKTVATLTEQNVASLRKAVDSVNAQTAKAFTATK